jgi:hypothetical protein
MTDISDSTVRRAARRGGPDRQKVTSAPGARQSRGILLLHDDGRSCVSGKRYDLTREAALKFCERRAETRKAR